MIRTINSIHYAYKQAPWRIQRQWISTFLLIVLGLAMIAALSKGRFEKEVACHEIHGVKADLLISEDRVNWDLSNK